MLEHRLLPVVLALILTGLGAATAGLLFKLGLDGLGRWRLRLLDFGPDLLLLPAIGGAGGLIAGLLVQICAPAAQGSGIPQVKQFLQGQPIPMNLKVALVKLTAGIVAIGCGFPLGPSGPSIQMGSSVGHAMANRIQAPKVFLRLIVASGGGAGIAAVFNAPIGGFFYALEELLRGARPVVMLLVLFTTFWADTWADLLGLAGLGSALTGLSRSGTLPLEAQVFAFFEVRPLDLVVLFALGAVVACAAEAYCRFVVGLHALRLRWRLPLAAGMAGVGVLLGLSDALLPADFINRAGIRQAVAEGDLDISRSLTIFVVLFLATGLAAAVGTPGGLFAPMLTLGGALGLAVAGAIAQLGAAAPSTVVFACMGAFVAACARTPITAMFLTFALTKDPLILKPLLVACLGGFLMAQLLHRQSLFERLIPPLEPDPPAGPTGPSTGADLQALAVTSVPLRPRKL
ncbi:ClC family H(+)/Cl(-) exchange transporter [Synechococcus sp. Cruz-9H2]|nr:ClC family H(+)/Cl(-) exchange transporter [Synechococcus sp. Cruz-9H2]MCP9843878.1 ClC family H(+)/Cl(-) exchange transporter [Synechococcus sp. Edmonson 11F2]MCP9855764.1 ClC family H(+)/Cl(-) exchange transporter [Synechococcus sp. Cruz-9C9]MCP9863288.1 ClC family H(+)/Cl(-) exchange transporter [Synechococcus sp. Cruz-7E5]MCP9870399.1 ClC family H(+)/Cl(-) exchange transporter [Synechococcus sp. Cruz-7B9]